ncbi:MAG: hypothetical protein ACK5LP_09235, partial [Campylobacteraceae bacterium]
VFILLGILLFAISTYGLFFSTVVKLFINKEREYLADASAVQFTRFPDGILGALKKIGAHGSMIRLRASSAYSHMYFSNPSVRQFVFATHPLLDQRIIRINPNWDGKHEVVKSEKEKKFTAPDAHPEVVKKFRLLQSMSVAYVLSNMEKMGTIQTWQIDIAQKSLDKIPKKLKRNIENPLEAEFIIYAMLLDKTKYKEQIENIAKEMFVDDLHVNSATQKIDYFRQVLEMIERKHHLMIIQLSTTTLKQMSQKQYENMKNSINKLINEDGIVSLFEWCIKYLVIYNLDIFFGIKKPSPLKYNNLRDIKFEAEVLLSCIAFAQTKKDSSAKEIFERVKIKTSITYLRYYENQAITSSLIERSIDELQKSDQDTRKKIIELSVYTLSKGNNVTANNLELLYALSTALHVPMGV